MTLKRALYKIHLWSGLCLIVFLLVQALSGAAISFRHELNRLLHPTVAVGDASAPRATLDEMTTALARRFPEFEIERAMLPVEPIDPVWFRLISPGAVAPHFALVNPHTGEVLKHGSIIAFPCELALYLHANLISGLPGQFIVGVMGVGLLVLSVTGIILWWPGIGNIAHRLKVRRSRVRAVVLLDWHTLIGAYALVGFVVLAFTGALIALRPFLPAQNVPITAWLQQGENQAANADVRSDAARASMQGSVAWAAELLPGVGVSTVFFETRDDVPALSSLLLRGEALPHTRAYHELILPGGSLAAAALARYEDQSLGKRFLDWMLPIHSGEVFGMPGRLLMLLFGIGQAAVVFTGAWMWFEREKVRRKRPQKVREAAATQEAR